MVELTLPHLVMHSKCSVGLKDDHQLMKGWQSLFHSSKMILASDLAHLYALLVAFTLQGPSSEALHLGHLVPFMFTKYLQVSIITEARHQAVNGFREFMWQ